MLRMAIVGTLTAAALVPSWSHADTVFTDAHEILTAEEFDRKFRTNFPADPLVDHFERNDLAPESHRILVTRLNEKDALPNQDPLHVHAIFSFELKDDSTAAIQLSHYQEWWVEDELWVADKSQRIDRDWLVENKWSNEWRNRTEALEFPIDGSVYLGTTFNNYFNDLDMPYHQQWGWVEIGIDPNTIAPTLRSSALARDVSHIVVGEVPKESPRIHTGRIDLITSDEKNVWDGNNLAPGTFSLQANAIESVAGVGNSGRENSTFTVTRNGDSQATLSQLYNFTLNNWFLVDPGTEFGPDYVASNEAWDKTRYNLNGGSRNDLTVPLNESFFLGANYDEKLRVGAREYFGWAQLFIDDDLDVTLLSSASINDGGTILVPEPATWIILALAGSLLARWRVITRARQGFIRSPSRRANHWWS